MKDSTARSSKAFREFSRATLFAVADCKEIYSRRRSAGAEFRPLKAGEVGAVLERERARAPVTAEEVRPAQPVEAPPTPQPKLTLQDLGVDLERIRREDAALRAKETVERAPEAPRRPGEPQVRPPVVQPPTEPVAPRVARDTGIPEPPAVAPKPAEAPTESLHPRRAEDLLHAASRGATSS